VHFAAMLNEEYKHAAHAIAQRKQWWADKKSGKTKDDFVTWSRKDAKSIWNDLLTRLDALEGKQQTEVTGTVISAFNLYYATLAPDGQAATSLE